MSLGSYNGYPVVVPRTWWRADDGSTRPNRSVITTGVKHLERLASADDFDRSDLADEYIVIPSRRRSQFTQPAKLAVVTCPAGLRRPRSTCESLQHPITRRRGSSASTRLERRQGLLCGSC